jgi:hypothetical protein
MSCRSLTLMLLAIFATVGSILFFTLAPQPVFAALSPVFCNPGETLRGGLAEPYVRDERGNLILGVVCSSIERTRDVSVVFAVAVFSVPVLLWMLFIAIILIEAAQHQALLRDGEAAVGKILAVHYTGVRVNGVPVYKIDMEIYSYNREPYQASARKRMGYYGISGPNLFQGGVVAVKIDPNKPQRVAIDDNADPDPTLLKQAGFGGAVNIPGMPGARVFTSAMTFDLRDIGINTPEQNRDSLKERLQQLKEAYDAGLITPQEYEQRRKQMLDEV